MASYVYGKWEEIMLSPDLYINMNSHIVHLLKCEILSQVKFPWAEQIQYFLQYLPMNHKVSLIILIIE